MWKKIITKLLIYLLVLIFILLIFLLVCQFVSLHKNNDSIEILQTEKPNIDVIQDTISNNQLTVFQNVLYNWSPIVHIFDASIDDIEFLIKNNSDFNNDLIRYLEDYSMFLSLGWEFKFKIKNKNTKDNHFILQNNYRQLFCQILGKQRFYLIPPKQSNLLVNKYNNEKKTLVSTVNFWNKNETAQEPFNKIKYIELILREGNILFIPKGWWYLTVHEDNNLILEAENVSFFNFFNLLN